MRFYEEFDDQPTNDMKRYSYSKPSGEELSTMVALSVADVLSCEIEDLQPLSDVVDIDSLDSLFASPEADIRLRFEYSGCLVSIKRGTEVSITPPDERA